MEKYLKKGTAESRIVLEDTKGNVIGLEIFNGSSLCAVTNEEILDISLQETTSLCVHTCEKDKKYLLACGQSNGEVSIWMLDRLNGKWDHKLLVKNQVHDGMVSSLSFLDDTRIVSGGIDRKISILKFGEDSDDLKGHQENILHMTIKCKGMKIDCMKGSKEQEMFKKLIQNE